MRDATDSTVRQRRTELVRRILTALDALLALVLVAALAVAYLWEPPEERSYRSPYLTRVPDRYVQTSLARFHYLRAGSGPPVVLIPGGTLWFYSYRKVIAMLARRSTVYAVDMPGQGYTRVSTDHFRYDLAAQSAALRSFMDAVGLPRAAVVGHSWGGAIALYFAERNRARVTRLGLLDTPAFGDDPTLVFRLLEFPVIGELIGKLLTRSSYESGLRNTYSHEQQLRERDVDEYWAPMSFRENRQALWLQQRRFDYTQTTKALDEVRVPTLVLWGDHDRLDAPRQAYELARWIPSASVRVFAGCGHTIQEDCPARTAAALAGFLAPGSRRRVGRPR